MREWKRLKSKDGGGEKERAEKEYKKSSDERKDALSPVAEREGIEETKTRERKAYGDSAGERRAREIRERNDSE